MTENEVTESLKPVSETHRRRVSGRRQFLKSTSLALPAVMTLHIQSVSAAATGTFFRCTQNGANDFVEGVIRGTDGCARRAVPCYYNFKEASDKQYAAFFDT